MSNIVVFSPSDGTVAGRVIQYAKSVNRTEFPTDDKLINPDVSSLTEVPVKYWKHNSGAIGEMSQAEKDAIDNYVDETEIGDKNFRVQQYSKNGRTLLSETWYEVDNGDDTYSIKVEETTYIYSGRKVTAHKVEMFNRAGTVVESEDWNYFSSDDNKIILKKSIQG